MSTAIWEEQGRGPKPVVKTLCVAVVECILTVCCGHRPLCPWQLERLLTVCCGRRIVCARLVEQSVARWEHTVSMYLDSRSLFHITNVAVVRLSYDYFFEKKNSLGFIGLPIDILTKSWSRSATVTSQNNFYACPLLLQKSHDFRDRKTAAKLSQGIRQLYDRRAVALRYPCDCSNRTGIRRNLNRIQLGGVSAAHSLRLPPDEKISLLRQFIYLSFVWLIDFF